MSHKKSVYTHATFQEVTYTQEAKMNLNLWKQMGGGEGGGGIRGLK